MDPNSPEARKQEMLFYDTLPKKYRDILKKYPTRITYTSGGIQIQSTKEVGEKLLAELKAAKLLRR